MTGALLLLAVLTSSTALGLWWSNRWIRRRCAMGVRLLEASRSGEAIETWRPLLSGVAATGRLRAALRYNLAVAHLRSSKLVEARALLLPLLDDTVSPPRLERAIRCHAAILFALCGETEAAQMELARARTVPAASGDSDGLPLVAAVPETLLLAEMVCALSLDGRLPSDLLEGPQNLLALDAHSMTAVRLMRAYERDQSGAPQSRVLEELLAVAAHGRPTEFAYLTQPIQPLHAFVLARTA